MSLILTEFYKVTGKSNASRVWLPITVKNEESKTKVTHVTAIQQLERTSSGYITYGVSAYSIYSYCPCG